MKGGKMIWLIGVPLALGALIFWFNREPTHTYRFKMTVEVETPEGPQEGHSVYKVSAFNTNSVLPDAAARIWNVKGEAVMVDLPGGRPLFALLKTNAKHGDMAGLSMTALDPQFKNDIVESAARLKSAGSTRPPAEVSQSDYPMLVTFGDLDDPTSVAEVDPDDLAATFGEGYALKGITVQITDEPVTTGIKKRLVWFQERAQARGGLVPMIKNERGRWQVASGFDASLMEIGLSDFSTEAYK